MKKNITFILSLALVLVLGLCLTGCMEVDTEPLDQQVRALLDCCAGQDVDGAYALMYPGAMDRDSYRASFDKMAEEFPIPEDYLLTLQKYNKNTMLGTNKRVVEEAQYLMEFGEQIYEITVEFRSDQDGSGFTDIHAASVWKLQP